MSTSVCADSDLLPGSRSVVEYAAVAADDETARASISDKSMAKVAQLDANPENRQ